MSISLIQFPIFPGCEELTDNDEIQICFSSKIKALTIANFNHDLIDYEYITIETGEVRGILEFNVDKEGRLTDFVWVSNDNSLKRAVFASIESVNDYLKQTNQSIIPAKNEDGDPISYKCRLPFVMLLELFL